MNNMARSSQDLIIIIRAQLPRTLQDKLVITTAHDPMMMRVKATFTDRMNADRTWQVDLEDQDYNNILMSTKIPDMFLAQLCLIDV